MVSFEQLWSEKYAARHAEVSATEEARRAEDFLDLPRRVCGLPLRVMTPRDLLLLDGMKSPFVCGGEIRPAHLPQFLFALHVDPPSGWWSEKRFFRHCAELLFDAAVAEIRAYTDRVFADQPRGGDGNGRPLGTNFLAPLIVRLASQIPALGPAEIMSTPLPQLFQYQKVLAANTAAKSGKGFKDYGAADRLVSECLDEVNALNAPIRS